MAIMSKSLSRRSLVKGAAFGLPLAAVLSDPLLAAAVASGLETISITTKGGHKAKAALAVPETLPAPGVILVHEWWGLNDQIKSTAAELAKAGYLVLAIDLYDGKVATTSKDARAYMKGVNQDTAADVVRSWVKWMKADTRGSGKIGTVGWCFGGGWSLMAGVLEPVDATVVYYGKVDRKEKQLARLKGPVLGHFATRDKWIDKAMVERFEAAMKAAGKPFSSHWYKADHAFANPTIARYDEADAKLAWQRTLAFFAENLS
jgi:carboxymethylenebutenolidase